MRVLCIFSADCCPQRRQSCAYQYTTASRKQQKDVTSAASQQRQMYHNSRAAAAADYQYSTAVPVDVRAPAEGASTTKPVAMVFIQVVNEALYRQSVPSAGMVAYLVVLARLISESD